MPYVVEFTPAAAKQIAKLPSGPRARVVEKAAELAENARPSGVTKLTGREEIYRVRVGEYRILYEIHDERLQVLVVTVGHRREVYR